MAKKGNPSRPKDINKLAKLIADISTGEVTEEPITTQAKPHSGKKKRTL